MVEVVTPPMGETVQKVIFRRWLKNRGDYVSSHEALFEVELADCWPIGSTEIPSPCAGLLMETLVKTGDVIRVNTTVAWIESTIRATQCVGVESASK